MNNKDIHIRDPFVLVHNDKYYMTMLPEYINKASEYGTVCPETYRSVVEEHGTSIVKSSAFFTIRNRFKE